MPQGRATIYDIARMLGISTGTVNRALHDKPDVSPETRSRVLDAARALGFVLNQTARNLARRPVKLALVVHNLVPEFGEEILRGGSDAGRELACRNVSAEIFDLPGTMEPEAFLAHLRALPGQGFDGAVVAAPSQAQGLPRLVEQLAAQGFQTGLLTDSFPGCCAFTLRKDALLAGRMAAELLCRLTAHGRVAVFTGWHNVLDHEEAVTGFVQELARRSGKLLAVYEHRDSAALAVENASRLVHEHPEVEGVYINNAMSEQTCRALASIAPHDVKIVTSDRFAGLEKLMREDLVQATIFQDPYRQDYEAMLRLYAVLAQDAPKGENILFAPCVLLQCEMDS